MGPRRSVAGNSIGGGELPSPLEPICKRLGRLHATRFAPASELSDVNPAVGSFAVVDPGLRTFELRPEFALRQSRLLAEVSKKSWDGSVNTGVLGLAGHKRTLPQRALDTISVSSQSEQHTLEIPTCHIEKTDFPSTTAVDPLPPHSSRTA